MAAHLGIEVGAVKTRLYKARAALRRRLWAEWKEENMATAAGTQAVEMRAAGATLREVRITKLEKTVFYASAIIGGSGGTRTVDARPSDAPTLAVITGAPICAASAAQSAHPSRFRSVEEMEGASQIAATTTARRHK